MLFAKKAKWAAKSNLYRKWLAEKFIHDIPRVAKDKWDDFDPMTCCATWGSPPTSR